MQEQLLREIDELVATGERLAADASRASAELSPERVQELSAIAARGGQLIHRLYGRNSHYDQALQRVLSTTSFSMMHSNYHRHVAELTGVLKGVQHDMKSGMLKDFRRLLQAEIFADFLEMAEHLLSAGYKDPAAVLVGAVLEDSLRKIADAKSVATAAPNGKPLTIDPLNIQLTKSGAYEALVQKQVTTWANLRNDAAHGHFDKYDADDVRHMLMFVQKFCADFLR